MHVYRDYRTCGKWYKRDILLTLARSLARVTFGILAISSEFLDEHNAY